MAAAFGQRCGRAQVAALQFVGVLLPEAAVHEACVMHGKGSNLCARQRVRMRQQVQMRQ